MSCACRNEAYDAVDITTQYLNVAQVKDALRARTNVLYVSCSPNVDQVMGHDVMKSVRWEPWSSTVELAAELSGTQLSVELRHTASR